MKQTLCVVILLSLLIPANAEDTPLWYSNKNVIYPESVFIRAVGSGKSIQNAQDDALTQLALYFNAQISVNTETNYAFTQQNAAVSANRRASGSTAVISETELPSVQFSEPYYNEARYTWNVCGYIVKKDAAAVCRSSLQNGIEEVSLLLAASQNNDDVFSAFSAAAKAVDKAASLRRDAEMLRVLSPGERDPIRSVFDLLTGCERRFSTLKRRMTFSVSVRNDPAGTFAVILQELLSSNGFICTEQNAQYLVEANITTVESQNAVGIFVRPGIVLSVTANDGSETVLTSYSKQYAKYGHITLNGAYAKAYAEIEQDLRLHFMELFY